MVALFLLLAAALPASAQDFAMPEELGAVVMSSRRLAADSERAAPAINAGFAALGPVGATGTVKGAGSDGTYRVIRNDPDQMVFDMKTGFVVGRFTLKRDPATGQDALIFTGRTRNRTSSWTATDAGLMTWELNGRVGPRSMAITLDGDAHTFTQN